MEEHEIPHEHKCSVCKKVIGCDVKYCDRPYWHVCDGPACQKIYESATVHRATDLDILPCCGVAKNATPQGDRMSTDPTRVTCKGKTNPVKKVGKKTKAAAADAPVNE